MIPATTKIYLRHHRSEELSNNYILFLCYSHIMTYRVTLHYMPDKVHYVMEGSNYHIPTQLTPVPSRSYPSSHVQMKLPSVLRQLPCWHSWGNSAHSFMSGIEPHSSWYSTENTKQCDLTIQNNSISWHWQKRHICIVPVSHQCPSKSRYF